MKIKSFIILGCILLIGIILRFYKLGEVPVGPNWDEAALGYNAYSIWNTGKDEYGISLPLSLRSYDDYKPPLYMYLTVPSMALFGLSLWSTRLTAAVNGVIAIIGVFFLAKELFSFSEYFKKWKSLPYISALLLAISPWHIQFSRIAFEANIGVTLNIFAVLFFLRGMRETKFLVLSGAFFALGLYAYHSQRIFAPLLVLLLLITFHKELLKRKQALGLFVLAGVITVLPLIPVFLNPTTLTRLRGTSAISDTTGLLRNNVQKLERDVQNNDRLGKFLDNRRFVYLRTIAEGYLAHYSLRWLFLEGDNARHHAPGMGLLYHLELPFFLLGLLYLFKKGQKTGIIILGWMVIAPIAASPTTELPHGIRTMVFLPSLQLATAVGVIQILHFFSKQKTFIRRALYLLIIIGGLLNFTYYLSAYFIQQNFEYSKFWQYGYQQAVEYAKEHYSEYDKIVVSTKLEQPHMFFLFHLKYDPKKYLEEGGTSSGGFAEVKNKFDKYEFRTINWGNETHNGSTLFIGSPSDVPESIHTIFYLDKQEAIHIAR